VTANLGLLVVIGVLYSCGVYLLLERSVTRVLLGVLLLGNATNLLLLTAGGPAGDPALVGRFAEEGMADPLAQGMVLTAIVITMGLAAFVLALTYRAFTLTRADAIEDDPEDVTVAHRRRADAPDRDRSESARRGGDTAAGDRFGAAITKDVLVDTELPPLEGDTELAPLEGDTELAPLEGDEDDPGSRGGAHP
jgi:multicomponent Na+:H+ antiporter subunit C